MEFTYHVFTRMSRESYGRRLRSVVLCSCDVFPALINFPCVLIPLVLKQRKIISLLTFPPYISPKGLCAPQSKEEDITISRATTPGLEDTS